MSNITKLQPSIRQQAEAEVKKELAERALVRMKTKLRELAAAESVVAGINLQLADLEAQIADGTL